MKIFILFSENNQYFAFDAQGEFVETGTADQLSNTDYLTKAKSIIGVIPGEQVTIKKLDLPIRQRSKLLQALPFALENDILGDIEEQHLGLVNWGSNQPVYVSICKNETIESYLAWAKEHKIRLTSLIPDFALYDVDKEIPYHFIARDAESVILIEDYFLRSVCDNDFIEHAARSLVSQDEEFEVKRVSVSSPNVARLFKSIPGIEYIVDEKGGDSTQQILSQYLQVKNTPYELLTEEYAPPSAGLAKYSLAIAASVLGLVIFSKVIFDHWLSYQLNSEISELSASAQKAKSEAFPNMRNFSSLSTVNFQIDTEIAKLQGSGEVNNEFMYLLQKLTRGLSRHNIDLEQISYRNNALVFNAKVAQFSQLQSIEQTLRESGDLDVKLISSGNQGDQVNARYEIKLK